MARTLAPTLRALILSNVDDGDPGMRAVYRRELRALLAVARTAARGDVRCYHPEDKCEACDALHRALARLRRASEGKR